MPAFNAEPAQPFCGEGSGSGEGPIAVFSYPWVPAGYIVPLSSPVSDAPGRFEFVVDEIGLVAVDGGSGSLRSLPRISD